jgi:hypothetical protein
MTIEISDRHTTDFVSVDAGVPGESDICVPVDAGPQGTIIDLTTGVAVGSGGPEAANACGNVFSRVLALTSDWQLYLLPFSSFHQRPAPSRRTDGLDPSGIFLINIRPIKEAAASLWLDEIGFYRAKGAGGADAAADARSDAATDATSGPPRDAGSDAGSDAAIDTDGASDASSD